jgi:cell shape-determining protein MreC
MAEQTQQQEQAGFGLSQQYNIGGLIGSLMDVQQVIRNVPNFIAAAEALKAENEKLKARIAELEAKAVETPAAE